MIPSAEPLDQRAHGGELGGRGRVVFEITDQADADAVFVVLRRVGVSAGFLAEPARSGGDPAVGLAVAVADDKVVSQTAPAALAMFLVEQFGAAVQAGRVMQDNVPPFARR